MCSMNDRETARTLLQSDCSDRFLVFFSVCPGMYQNSISNSAKTASSHILSISVFANHPVIRRCITPLLKASFNKPEKNKQTGILSFMTRAVYLRILRTVVSDGPPDCCYTAVLVSGRSCKFTRVFLFVPSSS